MTDGLTRRVRCIAGVLLAAASLVCAANAVEQPATEQAVVSKAKVTRGYVVARTGMHRRPNGAWLSSLYRGDRVTVLQEDGDWVEVRDVGESRGWVKKRRVLSSPDIRRAVAKVGLARHRKPDPMRRSKATVTAGILVLVLAKNEQFSLVNYSTSGKTWVLTDRLHGGRDLIDAARMMHRIRPLADESDERKELVDYALETFDSDLIKQWLGETQNEDLELENGELGEETPEPTTEENSSETIFDRFLEGDLADLADSNLPYKVVVSRDRALHCYRKLKSGSQPMEHQLLNTGWTPTVAEWKSMENRPQPGWRPRPLPDLCKW